MRVLRLFLVGLMSFGWLAGVFFGPVDRAVQRAVNAVVWEFEYRGVERARIYYAHDACIALTLLTLGAVERCGPDVVLSVFLVVSMHWRTAGRDFPPATVVTQMAKAILAWCGIMATWGHYLRHDTTGQMALSASYFVLLLLWHYVHRVPRTRPPRRRKAVAAQRVPA